MKIRNGFVSNSSSSSFVICGVKIPDDKSLDIYQKITKKTKEDIIEEMKKVSYYKDKEITDGYIEDYCYDALYDGGFSNIDIEIGEGVDGVVIGKDVAFCSDYGIETGDWDLDELKETVESIRKDIGLEDYPIKIYCGTKCC